MKNKNILIIMILIAISMPLKSEPVIINISDVSKHTYFYKNSDQVLRGLGVDVTELFMKHLKIEEYIFSDSDNKSGSDIIITISNSKDRFEPEYAFLKEPLIFNQYDFIILDKNKNMFNGLSDIKEVGVDVNIIIPALVHKYKIKNYETIERLYSDFIKGDIVCVYDDKIMFSFKAMPDNIPIYSLSKLLNKDIVRYIGTRNYDIVIGFKSGMYNDVKIKRMSSNLSIIKRQSAYIKIVSKYMNYNLFTRYIEPTESVMIYILLMSVLAIVLIGLFYNTLAQNMYHLNALVNIVCGVAIVACANFIDHHAIMVYSKIIGIVVISMGIFALMREYGNKLFSTIVFIITVLLGIIFSVIFLNVGPISTTTVVLAIIICIQPFTRPHKYMWLVVVSRILFLFYASSMALSAFGIISQSPWVHATYSTAVVLSFIYTIIRRDQHEQIANSGSVNKR